MNQADIRGRIRRLDELAGKLSVEALHFAQHRTALKPEETKAEIRVLRVEAIPLKGETPGGHRSDSRVTAAVVTSG